MTRRYDEVGREKSKNHGQKRQCKQYTLIVCLKCQSVKKNSKKSPLTLISQHICSLLFRFSWETLPVQKKRIYQSPMPTSLPSIRSSLLSPSVFPYVLLPISLPFFFFFFSFRKTRCQPRWYFRQQLKPVAWKENHKACTQYTVFGGSGSR